MKEDVRCFALGITFCLCLLYALFVPVVEDYDYVTGNTLRLHILANSNSEEDQQLKLQLRDDLLTQYGTILGETGGYAKAEEKIGGLLPEITAFLQGQVTRYGYGYKVEVVLTDMEFPTRVYDKGVVLPSGSYHALRIIIGTGKGENWWCVLYPPMCVPTTAETVLVEEERIIALNDQTVLKPKLATIELWHKLHGYYEVVNNLCKE